MRLLVLVSTLALLGCAPARTALPPSATCPLSLGLRHSRRIDAEARAKCERECSGGHADACVVLSIALEDARGGKEDRARAIAIAEEQCAAGYAPGARARKLFEVECREETEGACEALREFNATSQ